MGPFQDTSASDRFELDDERSARRDRVGRDRALANQAASQHGVITRQQLMALGFSNRQIVSRTNRSLWPRGTDVFAVGHPGLSRTGRAVGALMLAGGRAGLSHQSAARIWQMVSRSTAGPIHLSVLDRKQFASPDDVIIHRPPSLRLADLVDRYGLRLTTPERTLVDLLERSSIAEITRMLEQMITVLDRSPDDLHTWGHALAGVTGVRKLYRSLDDVAGPAVIRSEFETLFRTVCQEGGLPPALTNHRIGPWEVDAVYLDARVAVELDSWRWHGGKWQFHQDRKKGLAISRAGFELIRLTWPQLKYDRREVVEALSYALARGQSRPF